MVHGPGKAVQLQILQALPGSNREPTQIDQHLLTRSVFALFSLKYNVPFLNVVSNVNITPQLKFVDTHKHHSLKRSLTLDTRTGASQLPKIGFRGVMFPQNAHKQIFLGLGRLLSITQLRFPQHCTGSTHHFPGPCFSCSCPCFICKYNASSNSTFFVRHGII